MEEIAQRLEMLERIMILSSKNLLNKKEAALLLGVSEDRISHMMHERQIPFYKKGAKVYFFKEEIEDYVRYGCRRYKALSDIEDEVDKY